MEICGSLAIIPIIVNVNIEYLSIKMRFCLPFVIHYNIM